MQYASCSWAEKGIVFESRNQKEQCEWVFRNAVDHRHVKEYRTRSFISVKVIWCHLTARWRLCSGSWMRSGNLINGGQWRRHIAIDNVITIMQWISQLVCQSVVHKCVRLSVRTTFHSICETFYQPTYSFLILKQIRLTQHHTCSTTRPANPFWKTLHIRWSTLVSSLML